MGAEGGRRKAKGERRKAKGGRRKAKRTLSYGFYFLLPPFALLYGWYCFASAGSMHWKFVVHWVSEHVLLVLTAT